MKLVQSPLKLTDFYILQSKYSFVEPVNNKSDDQSIFEEYNLDFDFNFKKQDDGEVFLFTKISINEIEKPLSGYTMFVEAITIFEFKEKEKLSEKEIFDLLYISGLSISINNLRNYISNMTMYFPFGKYQLPAIDLNALHISKKEKLEAKKQVKNKKK